MELPDAEKVRADLVAKIKIAAPRAVQNRALARALELGNIDELRRHLAWAQILAEIGSNDDDPDEYLPPDPRLSTEELETRVRVLRTKTGNEQHPHSYVLAVDEWKWADGLYDGPRWVPFNLWELYRAGQPIISDCARKLIYGANAQALWTTIAERFERPDNIVAQLWPNA